MLVLQVKYIVEYDGVVFQNGVLTAVLNKKEIYLSTLVDIDSFKELPDYSNPDVVCLINDIKDNIDAQGYSRFAIRNIK